MYYSRKYLGIPSMCRLSIIRCIVGATSSAGCLLPAVTSTWLAHVSSEVTFRVHFDVRPSLLRGTPSLQVHYRRKTSSVWWVQHMECVKKTMEKKVSLIHHKLLLKRRNSNINSCTWKQQHSCFMCLCVVRVRYNKSDWIQRYARVIQHFKKEKIIKVAHALGHMHVEVHVPLRNMPTPGHNSIRTCGGERENCPSPSPLVFIAFSVSGVLFFLV